MIRLEKLEALGRKIRQDDPTELAIPTETLIREAIHAGKDSEALDLLEYEYTANQANTDSYSVFVDELITCIAGFGEDLIEKVLRSRYHPQVVSWLATTPGVVETLQRCAEFQRRHQGSITITEEPDRYVMTSNPCGSGGRLRRTRNVGTIKKAHPWSWSKTGIPYYCTHCCLFLEIIPIELRKYPIAITVVADKPEQPCIRYFYKKPELIPEKYFTRIGKTKAIK